MKQFIRISMLLDHYGTLLTEKQSEILTMYYEEDYSLSEIANTYNISRQAAFDTIKKGEAVLNKYESLLALSQKQSEREKIVEEIRSILNTVDMTDKSAANEIDTLLSKIID